MRGVVVAEATVVTGAVVDVEASLLPLPPQAPATRASGTMAAAAQWKVCLFMALLDVLRSASGGGRAERRKRLPTRPAGGLRARLSLAYGGPCSGRRQQTATRLSDT